MRQEVGYTDSVSLGIAPARTFATYLLLAITLLSGVTAAAQGRANSEIVIHAGPPGLGNGGPNPLSIPPSGADLDLMYVSARGFETVLSAVPGILLGMRFRFPGDFYTSLGGGILLNTNGAGVGVHSAFGMNFLCGWACLNVEYRQTLGIIAGRYAAPYVVRIGFSVPF